MKICRLTSEIRVGALKNAKLLFFTLFILWWCKIMSVQGRCVHDELMPTRGVSPQKYNHKFHAHIGKNSTARHRSSAHPTTSTHTRHTRIGGYYYRYRKIRHRTTPPMRHRRYVEDDSNSTLVNGTQPDDYATTKNSGVSDNVHNRTVQETLRYKSASRRVNEGYKPESRNETSDESKDEPNETIQNETVNLSELFRPIRISLYFDDDSIDYKNTSNEYARLVKSLERAVKKIEKMLSVIPVQGPLLFSRNDKKICSGFWGQPLHPESMETRRCGIPNAAYNGEKCLDGFKIPDDHLRGYSIYNKQDKLEPTRVLFEDGKGLPDTDTVIYIHAEKTNMCRDKGVIAYATYCQLDQNSRPIAGFANFCPGHLEDMLYNHDTLYLTALHEFFHALGFSKDLFDKFQECFPQPASKENMEENETTNNINGTEMEWVCEERGKTVSFIDNRKHIITPAVARETQKHLNCSTKHGCPLENHVVLPLRTSSHWEGRFMQGSLMSPTIGLPHLTVIDRITLGAFEDMGWYHVDYSEAADLPWGKSAGCNFSTTHDCLRDNSPYFCNRNNARHGCHYLHLDKGTCETDKYLDRCKMYTPHTGMECWKPNNYNFSTSDVSWKGEVYSLRSRCFMSNLVSSTTQFRSARYEGDKFEGRCYLHRCNDSNTLEVQVNGTQWRLCPEGSLIEFEGYEGLLRCPPASLLCAYDLTGDSSEGRIGSTNNSRQRSPFCATIQITFPKLAELRAQMRDKVKEPKLAEQAQHKLDMFLMKFTNEIVAVSEIDETRIVDRKIVNDYTVEFVLMKNIDWTTVTPKDPDSSLTPGEYEEGDDPNGGESYPVRYGYIQISCEEAVRRLLVSVMDGDFKVPLNGQVYKASSVNFTSNEGDVMILKDLMRKPPEKPTSQTGTTAAATVGAICGTILLAVGALLYWKSHVTTAVSPAPPSPTSTDVRYQTNGSVVPSENGSMGQLTFMP